MKTNHYNHTDVSRVKALYYAIISQCYHTHVTNYPYYGGVGIKVCKRWLKGGVNVFIEDVGIMSDRYKLCRIDKTKDYKPSNMEWVLKGSSNSNIVRASIICGYKGFYLPSTTWSVLLGKNKQYIRSDHKRYGLSFQQIIKRRGFKDQLDKIILQLDKKACKKSLYPGCKFI